MRYFLNVLLFFCLSLHGASRSDLLTLNNTAQPALLQLLHVLKVDCENDHNSIVASTQESWLQIGKERWEFEPKEEEQKTILLPLLRELGMIDGIHAQNCHYDYALIHGGLYSRVQDRIDCLIQEFEKGVRFNQVILLTGQRYLDSHLEERDLPFPVETDMMLFLWENAPIPNTMRTIPVTLIDAPRLMRSDGTSSRPGTKETLLTWLETKPHPGTCLFISNQPFCGYQDAVARTHLPSSFTVETIGKKAENTRICVYLDNLARWLYQEKQARDQHGR